MPVSYRAYGNQEQPQPWWQEQYYQEVRSIQTYWPQLGTLERGEAIVSLLKYPVSMRRLASIVGCSEGTIRNYEIIGRLTPPFKQALRDGRYSVRQIVGLVRRLQKQVANNRKRWQAGRAAGITMATT